MNYKMVLNILGKTFIVMALLILLPMMVGFCYNENNIVPFLVPALVFLVIGVPFAFFQQGPWPFLNQGLLPLYCTFPNKRLRPF